MKPEIVHTSSIVNDRGRDLASTVPHRDPGYPWPYGFDPAAFC